LEQKRFNGEARAVAATAPVDKTVNTVRQLMAAEELNRQIRGKPVTAEALPGPGEAVPTQSVKHKTKAKGRKKLNILPALSRQRSAEARGNQRSEQAGENGILARLGRFEPTKRQGFFLLFVAAMLWKPWLIPGLVFLTILFAVIAYFTIGPDRVAELTATAWEKLSKRFPERSERILGKIQRGADRLDGWLARLPDRWTDGFYLPDFGRSAGTDTAADGRDDPFERLAAERKAVLSGERDQNGQVRP